MKNIKMQLVRFRTAMAMKAWEAKNKVLGTSGEGYVDTASASVRA